MYGVQGRNWEESVVAYLTVQSQRFSIDRGTSQKSWKRTAGLPDRDSNKGHSEYGAGG